MVITDDQSWEHLGAYGSKAVRTPAMDQIARDGVRFTNAFCASPSCSPSRAAILTGQDIFRLEEGGVLTGFLRKKFEVFPLILERNGYRIGYTGKPYAPVFKEVEDSYKAPLGKGYSVKVQDSPQGISRTDYASSFDRFLEETTEAKPFFFWIGMSEPHLPHPAGYGEQTGIDLSKIRVPAFYPDTHEIRQSLADYLYEIEWADAMLGRILNTLDERNLSQNTLIVFTSDNGMPFPKAKATLYDHGVRMPLIIRWSNKIKSGREVEDPVSLINLAPTILELANLEAPEQMTGQSIEDLLFSNNSGVIDSNREFVVSAFGKHTLARPGLLGFPRRAIHTKEWTYIVNYESHRYPAGREDTLLPGWGIYGDIDPSGIKSFFLKYRSSPEVAELFELGFGKVPKEELFNRINDPDMIQNLAGDPNYSRIQIKLRRNLETYLSQYEDPRTKGLSPWDGYNYNRPFPVPNPDYKTAP